jgi:hypothetical protein
MASLAASAPSGARGIVALTGTSRNTALSTSFLGFNAGAGTFNAEDSSFEAALSALRPETIRVFGGTGSNYINWQTGRYFVDSPVSQFSYIRTDKPQTPTTLADYVTMLKASGATAVFQLNVMTYCASPGHPNDPDVAAASCALSAAYSPDPHWGLGYQLTMLQAAQQMGVPVKFVELGNELYNSNADYTSFFPSVQSYIAKVNVWIAAIKSAFPGVQVGVVGFAHTAPVSVRSVNWNQEVLAGVHGESAMTFHTYFSNQLNGGSVVSKSGATTMLSEAAQLGIGVVRRNVLPILPKGVQAWLTEWNVEDPPGVSSLYAGSWSQGLVDAVYAVDLARTAGVGLSDVYTVTGNQVWGALFATQNGYVQQLDGRKGPIRVPGLVPQTVPLGTTGEGLALGIVLAALHGATATSMLNFSADPKFGHAATPGIIGQAFSVGHTQNLLLVNLTGSSQLVSLGRLAGSYSQSQFSARPSVFVNGEQKVRTVPTASVASLSLPADSVTALIS